MQDLYGSNGYVFADVRPETVFLEEPGQVDLVYHIDEGERFRVGRIFVHIGGDNPHTRIQTALNRVTIYPGARSWTSASSRRASDGCMASSVFTTRRPGKAAENHVPDSRATPTWSLAAGAGPDRARSEPGAGARRVACRRD